MSNQIPVGLPFIINSNREASAAVYINCGLRYLGCMQKSALIECILNEI